MRATVSLEGQLLEWPPHNPDRWWAGNCSADPPRGSIGPTRMRPRKLGNRAAAGGQLIGSASSNVRLQTKLVAAAHQTSRLWPSGTRGSGECRVNQIVDGATAWLILLTS